MPTLTFQRSACAQRVLISCAHHVTSAKHAYLLCRLCCNPSSTLIAVPLRSRSLAAGSSSFAIYCALVRHKRPGSNVGALCAYGALHRPVCGDAQTTSRLLRNGAFTQRSWSKPVGEEQNSGEHSYRASQQACLSRHSELKRSGHGAPSLKHKWQLLAL